MRRLREFAAVTLLASVLTVLMTWPLAARLGSGGRTDNGDGLFSIWVVSWVAHALTTPSVHLFDANIFYPERNTLAYSEANVGAGALGVPVWVATHNPYATHNAVVLIAFAMAFGATYLLARRLVGPGAPAVTAGVVFAFCPYVFSHTSHIQLLMTAGVPAALAAMHWLIDRPGAAPAVTLGVVLFAGAISCGYYGTMAGLLVGAGILVFSVTRGRWRQPAWWGWVTLAAVIACALSWPFFEPYRQLTAETGFRRGVEDAAFYTNVDGWRASAALVHDWLTPGPGNWPEVMFPGFVAVLAGLGGLAISLRSSETQRRPPRDIPLFYLGVCVVLLWLTFGPAAGLYRVFYAIVPLFHYLRVPGRFSLGVVSALSVGVAYGIAWLEARWPSVRWIGSAALALALVDLFQPPYPMANPLPSSAVYRVLAAEQGGGVLELPYYDDRPSFDRHAWFMVQSIADWHPRVNGYSDYASPTWRVDAHSFRHFPTADGFVILRRRHVHYVVVHRELYGARDMSETDARFAQFKDYLKEVVRDGPVVLYEVTGFPTP